MSDRVGDSLATILSSHRLEKDGGERLDKALKVYEARLSEEELSRYTGLMEQWSLDQTGPHWGIALRAITRVGSEHFRGRMLEHLLKGNHDLQRGQFYSQALIAMGERSADLLDEVKAEAMAMTGLGLPNLFSFLRADPSIFPIVAETLCLLLELGNKGRDYVRSKIALLFFVAELEGSLAFCRLLKESRRIGEMHSHYLWNEVADYMERAFVRRRVGESFLAELKSTVNREVFSEGLSGSGN
ncbi:MAG: hypothetical protein ACPG31_03175 [Planctomycetota bacterium]